MASLREKAIARKAAELRDDARQLERISRDQPRVSKLAGEAHSKLAEASEHADTRIDATLTVVHDDELRRRAMADDDALAELCRRSRLPAAA